MTYVPTNIGNLFKTGLMRSPDIGSQCYALTFDFTNTGLLTGDLFGAEASGGLDFVQSIFIDNSANAASFSITFYGGGVKGHNITAQPYTQGYYPLPAPLGKVQFAATTSQGQIVPIEFFNIAVPYFVWGPISGVAIVPPLVNAGLIIEPCLLGDNVLAAGALGQTVKLYRGIFNVGAAALLKFTDGPGGAVLFAASLTPGGSLTFQPSGIPWITTSSGNALVLNMSAAVNLYGGYGTVTS